MRQFRRIAFAIALCFLAVGCEVAIEPTPAPTVPQLGGPVQPLCQVGCVEIDSFPNAPGVFLGSGVTPLQCFDGVQSDADQDGLGDFCEKQLAWAFAPELYYWSGDNVGRESYWVARPEGTNHVLVGYLLSYYRDEGSNAWPCGLPGAPSSCNGHNGDSEAIFLDLYYNDATNHWVLDNGRYSQHGAFVVYGRGTKSYPTQLFYPSHPGSYPRAYVSEGKHANYRTANDCNNGGFLDIDTCTSVNTAARVIAGANLNLGSRAYHSSNQDCVASTNTSYEHYGSGRLECYWTTQNFRGWIPTTIGGAESSSYSSVLSSQGF